MSKLIVAFLITASAILYGCPDDFREEDYYAGQNGEPPKKLKLVYSKKFVAEQKNYVRALGEIHAFLIENDFYPVYRSCFHDVLDIIITADVKKHKEAFPCVAVGAEKGAPTKIYLTLVIDEVMFNQLDHNNRLMFTVSMYGSKDLIGYFSANVESNLRAVAR